MIIVIFLTLFVFYLIYKVANDYLSTAVTSLVEYLQMNQNFAGVTLLAFGNGAPDVIVSFLASENEERMDYALSTLLGGSISVGILTFSIVLIRGGKIKVQPRFFIRDIVFFLVAIGGLYVLFFFRIIGIWLSLAFFSIYLIFIFVAFKIKGDEREIIKDLCTNEIVDFKTEGTNRTATLVQGIVINNKQIMRKTLKYYAKKVTSVLLKILVVWPIELMFAATIPNLNETNWNKHLITVMPVFSYFSFLILSNSLRVTRL